ncbi:MAG: DEAD/DEAH box helicase family protein [Candidatus Delongbacteria bacterium]|nr:DEAD/DEAH box helicase family protein [Candidatus Delongbacteria bacterium]
MIIKHLEYKEKAIKRLLEISNELLDGNTNENLIFKAPTGAGKTIIIADFLLRLIEKRTDNKTLSFIWAAPRKLHLQSYEKLEEFYKQNRVLECSNIEELTDKKISENEILFLNWESINKKDNVFIRENENDFNLTSIISNTIEDGREIILVIDESHHTASAENTKGLIEIMKPKITIEVSATPHMTSDNIVKVKFEDVVREGMIKEKVSLNPNLKEEKLEGEGSDEFILKEALKKRVELSSKFKEIGKEQINPLLLIQLPDSSSTDVTNKTDEIENLLAKKFNITTENGKLAVYLSEDKRNLENISKNDNEVDVLLFKQAIALGWDCPRAYILVLFREWHSEKFSIQTVGRIMRMPEIQHYSIEELDKGYVYTNIANNNIKIEEELARDYFTIYTSKRNESYSNIDLVSYHLLRQRETTRLDPSFINSFLMHARQYELAKKLDTKVSKITDHIPLDGIIHVENIGTANEPVEIYKDLSLAKNTLELENAFKYFIQQTLHEGEMYPEQRSIGRACTSIYHFFSKELNMDYQEVQREIITIVLAKGNIQPIKDVFNLSLKEYKAKHPKKRNKSVQNVDPWNVPVKIEFNANHQERKPKLKKVVMNPYYESTSKSKSWQTEKSFIEFLDNNKQVEWWFKNGEGDGTYFAVPYIDDSKEEQSFYVDFIVKFSDGRIGLFDTKSGWTAKDAGNKSDGLQKYIIEQNKKRKNLFGGIIVPKSGSFFTYTEIPYKYVEDLTDWKILNI